MTARMGRILKADQTRPSLRKVDDDHRLAGDDHHAEPCRASGDNHQYGIHLLTWQLRYQIGSPVPD